MITIKKEPKQIYDELQKGVSYNQRVNLYETVKENENFYIGKQWEGVNAPDLEKPVLNFLKRVVSYFVAMLVSDDVAACITPFQETEDNKQMAEIISAQIPQVLEQADAKAKFRDLIRNAAVDADGYIYTYFDANADIGQTAKGKIEIEIIDNTNVIYGNPYSNNTQKQPYILVIQRKMVEEVRSEAIENGMSEEEAQQIQVDSSDLYVGEESYGDDLCTVITKLWKESGTVRATKTTFETVIKKPWNTGYKRYPISPFVWEKVKNSYHGMAAITGFIPNQIAANKLFAMAMHSVKTTAFPKIFYDNVKIKKWINKVGEAIGVAGDPSNSIFTPVRGTDMSNQVMEIIRFVIDITRDFMGASDAALGNVKPENTSAIIVAREATGVPLELQRMGFYQTVEDLVRNIIDIMRQNYGTREVSYQDIDGATINTMFDFSVLEDMNYKLNVDIGPSSYWSEITQQQTLDGLYKNGIIKDAIMYVEEIPKSQLRNKNTLLAKLKKKQQEELDMLQGQMAAKQAESGQGANNVIDLKKILSQLSTEELEAVEANPDLLKQISQEAAA
jgi:hypothetical protein